MGLPLLLYPCWVLNGKSLVWKNRNADLPPEIGFCFCKTECGRFDEVANDPSGAKTSAGLFSVGRSESYCNSHYDDDANFPIAFIWFSAWFYFIPSRKFTASFPGTALVSPFKALWRISSSVSIFSDSVLGLIMEPAEKIATKTNSATIQIMRHFD